MTVSARSVFVLYTFKFYIITFESSYFNLKSGIKQSKISQKFAEQWLMKAKILGPTDDSWPYFFRKMN